MSLCSCLLSLTCEKNNYIIKNTCGINDFLLCNIKLNSVYINYLQDQSEKSKFAKYILGDFNILKQLKGRNPFVIEAF